MQLQKYAGGRALRSGEHTRTKNQSLGVLDLALVMLFLNVLDKLARINSRVDTGASHAIDDGEQAILR